MTKIKNKRLLECGFRFCCLDWWFNRRIMIWLILMMWMIFPARFGYSRDLDYLISNEKIKTDKPRIRLTSRNIFGYLWSHVYSQNSHFFTISSRNPTGVFRTQIKKFSQNESSCLLNLNELWIITGILIWNVALNLVLSLNHMTSQHHVTRVESGS